MMLFNRAEMLNRRANQPKFKAAEIVEALAPGKGAVVADIGSGGGCFTMRFAEAVGLDGRVYAVDTNAGLLAYIDEYAREHQLTNVETVWVEGANLRLPKEGCDLIFARNVFHHLDGPEDYFRKLSSFLKPPGEVAVIDYKRCSLFSLITLMGHYVKEDLIIETMKNAGYVVTRRYDFLPEQSFNVFATGSRSSAAGIAPTPGND